ncbi:zinc finger protein ZAT11 [Cajanus cajan]|uniref:Zinc finger protein 1 n=1 Tax=Cajanus cajan TaxID=3821 RepID=A0A151QXG0_CAJCA|nr:zinc finger protein ZAT11 [Cajanus cajan]KYP34943.1 Zinc finger protein 1 [Cajanus cajan]
MKREREKEGTTLESWDVTNCAMTPHASVSTNPQVFECKTCNRKFSSFQALGGHRASHKRVRLGGEEQLGAGAKSMGLSGPKMHECSICGQGFLMGQALGGHMRRHRDRGATNKAFSSINEVVAKVSVFKRSCNAKVFCLDLNLTPLENDFKLLLFGKVSPKVNLSSF